MKKRVYRFLADHQLRQRLILRALEEMDSREEKPEETSVVTEMINELEDLLARPRRGYSFRRKISVRKRA